MRRIAILSLIGGIALVGVVAAAPAALATKTVTFHIHNGTSTEPARNPCTGVHGTVTLVYNAVFHKTKIGPGLVHVTATTTGSFEFTPKVSKFPSYAGHFTQWDGFNSNARNVNGTFTFIVNGIGSDGSHLAFHEVAHFSISASGATLQFDRPSCA